MVPGFSQHAKLQMNRIVQGVLVVLRQEEQVVIDHFEKNLV